MALTDFAAGLIDEVVSDSKAGSQGKKGEGGRQGAE